MTRSPLLGLLSMTLIGLLMWSGLHAHDLPTWLLETLPVMLVLPVLWLTCRRFPLTVLLYSLIFLHAIVLIVGGTHTYARVPLGFALQEWLGLDRNPYDNRPLFSGPCPGYCGTRNPDPGSICEWQPHAGFSDYLHRAGDQCNL
jgi:uncharacterized membrane protein YjdF